MSPIKSFISYGHDNDSHKEKVKGLSDRLRDNGINCVIDQYDPDPEDGWCNWVMKQIKDSDYVIVIFSKKYHEKMFANDPSGINFESRQIVQLLNERDSVNQKVISAIVNKDDKCFIPNPFSSRTYYDLSGDRGYIELYKRLTMQYKPLKPPLGSPIEFPAESSFQSSALEDEYGKVTTKTGTIDMEITINADFESFSEADQDRILKGLAHLIKVPGGTIKIKNIRRGSVIIRISIPSDKAEELRLKIMAGALEYLDVESIDFPVRKDYLLDVNDQIEPGTEMEKDFGLIEGVPRWLGYDEREERKGKTSNKTQVKLLKQGVSSWNKWRNENTETKIYLSEINLKGANLAGANLAGAYLFEAKLSEANLSGANLSLARLEGANLSKADLSKAKLWKANLWRAGLSGTNFAGADLSGADLSEADLSEANLSGADLYFAQLPGANVSKANLSKSNPWKANLSKANLSGADLSGADLAGADFSGADLSKANLSGADLYYARFEGANASKANLSKAQLWKADLSKANFSAADLSATDLSEANISEADLSGANLSGADLSGSDLSEVNFSEADLYYAQLQGSNLCNADLSKAHLWKANLSKANLSGADLSGADFYDADLSGADLSKANLHGVNFDGANLKGAII